MGISANCFANIRASMTLLLKLVNSEQTVVSLLKSIKVDLNEKLCADIIDQSKGRAYCS
jgi:hypothetical protein